MKGMVVRTAVLLTVVAALLGVGAVADAARSSGNTFIVVGTGTISKQDVTTARRQAIAAGRTELREVPNLAQLVVADRFVLPPVVVARFAKHQVERIFIEPLDPLAVILDPRAGLRESLLFRHVTPRISGKRDC